MTWLRDDALTYDLRGKLVSAIGSQGTMDQFTAIYSGLGYLMETTLDSDGQATTGHGQHFFTREQFAYDGMGRLHFAKDSTDVFQTTGPGGSRSSSTNIRQNTYFQTVADLGRLNLIDAAHQSYSHEYDEGGSLVFVESAPDFPLDNTPAGSWDDRASYYDALGQLVASDKGFMADAAVTPDGWFRRIFEEYRYDALGRRVLVRMRQFCANNGPAGGLDAQCNYHSVRRTVWDRDQELWEIQMPDDPAHRETDVAVGAAEIPDMVDQTATPIDLNMLWGRVAYTHAGAVDRPLAVHRLEYADHPDQQSLIRWPLFTNLPLYDYKGEVTTSAYANGAKNHCNPVGSTRCVFQAWPAGYFAYWRQGLETLFWHGTLVRDKRDMTGTHYRRNRYYDPNSGQFTQEDPIGLAGGLNLYGFANGDPVNFSDPFGLNAEASCPPCIAVALAAWGAYEVGSGAYDVYNAVRTVFSDASTSKKIGAVSLAAASLALPGGGYSGALSFSRRQLQSKFKHAADFGVAGKATSDDALAAFSSALQSHVDGAGTQAIRGTFRGQAVIHHVDPATGLNVMQRESGEFLSGFKLSDAQLDHVLRTGKLGGGN